MNAPMVVQSDSSSFKGVEDDWMDTSVDDHTNARSTRTCQYQPPLCDTSFHFLAAPTFRSGRPGFLDLNEGVEMAQIAHGRIPHRPHEKSFYRIPSATD